MGEGTIATDREHYPPWWTPLHDRLEAVLRPRSRDPSLWRDIHTPHVDDLFDDAHARRRAGATEAVPLAPFERLQAFLGATIDADTFDWIVEVLGSDRPDRPGGALPYAPFVVSTLCYPDVFGCERWWILEGTGAPRTDAVLDRAVLTGQVLTIGPPVVLATEQGALVLIDSRALRELFPSVDLLIRTLEAAA